MNCRWFARLASQGKPSNQTTMQYPHNKVLTEHAWKWMVLSDTACGLLEQRQAGVLLIKERGLENNQESNRLTRCTKALFEPLELLLAACGHHITQAYSVVRINYRLSFNTDTTERCMINWKFGCVVWVRSGSGRDKKDPKQAVRSRKTSTKCHLYDMTAPSFPDRWLPSRLNRILPISGLLRGSRWYEIDVSGLTSGPIFKGPAVLKRRFRKMQCCYNYNHLVIIAPHQIWG
jgi:hypothetical protein